MIPPRSDTATPSLSATRHICFKAKHRLCLLMSSMQVEAVIRISSLSACKVLAGHAACTLLPCKALSVQAVDCTNCNTLDGFKYRVPVR